MYSLNMPVSALRTKVRQEFERHRYVNQLPTVDVLIFKSHSEYQVRIMCWTNAYPCIPRDMELAAKEEHELMMSTGRKHSITGSSSTMS